MDNIDILFKNHSFNSKLLLRELKRRGVILLPIRKTKLVKATFGRHCEVLYDIYTNLIPYTKGMIIDDKYFAKQFLKSCGFNVNSGEIFDKNHKKDAILYAKKIGFPVVLKPTTGSHGENVCMDIENDKELKFSIDNFLMQFGPAAYFLVEKEFVAKEFRIFLTKNDFFAAVERTPANVIGDGKSTIRQLIKTENWRRMNPRVTCLCKIPIDNILNSYINKQNLALSYIPKRGEKVFLRKNSNVSTGGNCYDVTNTIHHSYIKLGQEILRSLAVPFLGIDLLCKDITNEISDYRICELNSAPGLSLHMMPETGKARNVAGALANIIFPETYEN